MCYQLHRAALRRPRAPPAASSSALGGSSSTNSLMDSAPEFEEVDECFVPAALQPAPEPAVAPLGGLGLLGGGAGVAVPVPSLFGLGLPAKPAEPAADKAPPSLLEAALGDLNGDTGKSSRVRRVPSILDVTALASSCVSPPPARLCFGPPPSLFLSLSLSLFLSLSPSLSLLVSSLGMTPF